MPHRISGRVGGSLKLAGFNVEELTMARAQASGAGSGQIMFMT